jgi:hypothetical protein
MAQQYGAISNRLAEFIAAQHVFFVATAAREGRVNVSPKGLDGLRVLGPNRVVWLNGTGSGNESAAHLLDVNRMTLMFCSFERQPLIVRLYGTAAEIQRDQPEWDEYIGLFPPHARRTADLRHESRSSPDLVRLRGSLHGVRRRSAADGAMGREEGA